MTNNWYQGTYKVVNKEKYLGSRDPVFRSSWESRLMYWLDTNNKVKKWCSECIKIPYINIVDGRQHTYITDAYAEICDNNGNVKKYIIEVKPAQQGPVVTKNGLYVPKAPKNKNKKALRRYLTEVRTYRKNESKWKAAQAFCKKRSMEFVILTKEDLF